jgi:hypothetical protein
MDEWSYNANGCHFGEPDAYKTQAIRPGINILLFTLLSLRMGLPIFYPLPVIHANINAWSDKHQGF